jgi:hypothetical protein
MNIHLPLRRPNVLEHQIDELIARRMKFDPMFAASLVNAVLEQVSTPIPYTGVGVDRQVRHEGAAGTIDLMVRLFDENAGETGRILLENKLDSSFTHSQPERYASSAVAMSRAGRTAVAAICAPAEYLKRSKYLDPFGARLAYEDIASWLDGPDRYRTEAAILRFSMPYEPDPVPEVMEFHEGYVLLAGEIAPDLVVKPNPNTGGERPETSRTIYFIVRQSLPSYDFLPTLRFSHQCWDSSAPSASVKVMFDGWAKYERLLRRVAAPALANTPLYLRKAGRSLGLVCDTPRLDNKKPVRDQLQAVSAGIRAAATLRAWMFANEQVLQDWARAVSEIRD